MNPVLVEVTRGNRVESQHRGAVCVRDADGGIVAAVGDIDAAIFPRSAVKALQALPLVESGIADRLGLTDAELALACASHSGEAAHVAAAAAMLTKAGRDEDSLECGAHWPLGEAAARTLARSGGEPRALHNNCSGKHAGFVCLACGLGADPRGYVESGHIVQHEVRAALEALTGVAHSAENSSIDGCSIPTYAVPVRALALAFARFGAEQGMQPLRALASRRLRQVVAANPHMVAGTGRFDTRIMTLLGIRAFTKTGAEGVFCAALPELGLGIALKCDDGGTRAAEVMLAATLQCLLALSEHEKAGMRDFISPLSCNWNGIVTGGIAPTPEFRLMLPAQGRILR